MVEDEGAGVEPEGGEGDGGAGDPPSHEASADEGAGLPRRRAGRRDAKESDEPERIQAARNRGVQRQRRGRRKYFDEAAQADFLEWFAATANLDWSAKQAGFNYKTVLKHRMYDARFREGWNRAIEQGYARAEAKRLETKCKKARIGIEGDRDAPEMDDMPPERLDAILREHKRELAGIRKPGRRPRVASNEEVRDALEKSLIAFAEQIRAARAAEAAGGAESDPASDPLHRPADGPEPGRSLPRSDLGLPGAAQPDSPRPGEDQ